MTSYAVDMAGTAAGMVDRAVGTVGRDIGTVGMVVGRVDADSLAADYRLLMAYSRIYSIEQNKNCSFFVIFFNEANCS